MPPPGWLRALGGLIISCLCSASCTSFRCGSASCSRSKCLSTSPCPAMLRATWSTTVHWLRCMCQDNCVLLTPEARCQPDVQQFRRQDLHSCWNQSVEQFAVRPETIGTVIRPGQVVTEEIYLDSETTVQCELF